MNGGAAPGGRLDSVSVFKVRVPPRLREVDPVWVDYLASVIQEQGFTSALIVRPAREITRTGRWGKAVPGRFDLVAGAHRLAAAKKLGLASVPATIVDPDSPDAARLIEIDENLGRHELRPLDRAVFLAERKTVYERLHPETRHGAQGGRGGKRNENESVSFSKATADRLGMSRRTIEQSVRIAQRIAPEVRKELARNRLLEKQTELLAVADLPTVKQVKVVQVLLGGKAARVTDALAKIEGRSAKSSEGAEEQYRKLVEAWHRSSKSVQRRFVTKIVDKGFSDGTDGVLAWVSDLEGDDR